MSDKKINLVINGKNNSGPALTSAQKALGALETAAVRLGPLVVGALGARAIKEAADLWIRQEDAIKQVESRLISTRGVSGQTSAGLQAMASSLQGVTKYGDEATLEMQSLLLTFTQIQGPVFGQATEAIMNVATAMKRDLSSAALQVGKALNDPILGVSALAESGIQFTQSQKSVIKALVDTGDVAGAQKIILGELEVQFGGAARAAREGMGGSVTAMGNAFSDVMEQLGRGAANGGAVGLFDSITTSLTSAATAMGDFNQAVEDLKNKDQSALLMQAMAGVRVRSEQLAAAQKQLEERGWTPAGQAKVDGYRKALERMREEYRRVIEANAVFVGTVGPIIPDQLREQRAGQLNVRDATAADIYGPTQPDVDRSNQYGPMMPNDVWQERRDERFAGEQEWNARMLTLQIEAGNQQALAAEDFAQQEIEAARKEWEMKTSAAANGTAALMNLTNALYVFGGKKSRAMFEANKIAGIANIGVSTYTAAAGAMKDTPGPYWVRLLAAGAITAAGLAQAANVSTMSFDGGGTPSGGYGGGTPTSPVVTQPGGSSQQAPQEITIKVIGVISDATVENLVDRFNDAGSRGVRIDYSQG
jgi:hypothetical protein